MDSYGRHRRAVLLGTTSMVGLTLAGCLGDDGNGDSGDSNGATGNGTGGSGESGSDRPDEWPDDPAFRPSQDVDAPGGGVTLAMQFQLNATPNEEQFESLEVDFDVVRLHQGNGDTVEVPIEQTFDFFDFELRTDLTLVFDLAIPAGTYTELDFVMDAVSIVHEEDGDVTEYFESPPRAEFSSDDGAVLEDGDEAHFNVTFSMEYVDWDDFLTIEESAKVGHGVAHGIATDPQHDAYTD